MNAQPDVVITGLGLATSLGLSPEATWSAIIEGRAGIRPMTALEQRPIPDKGGAQALELPENYHPSLPRASRYLRFVISQALDGAFGGNRPASRRSGVVLGTTLHGMRAGGDFLRSGNPRTLASFLAGSILECALDGLDLPGPRLSTCSACSSGLGAIILGATLLRAKQIDVAICGGYDPVSEYSYAGFDSLRLISEGPDGPRPFSADRDGMKVGEGYGIVILERADDAVGRRALVRAYLAGCAETSDAFHLTQPEPAGTGAAEAARLALRAAAMEPGEVDMISAHATATPNNDAAEYAALSSVFGSALAKTPVVAFKSYVGHTLGGAGAVELILSILSRDAQCVPATVNTRQVDPEFANLRIAHKRPLPHSIRTTINLSLGFGGANACVVLSQAGARRERRGGRDEPHDNQPVITGIGVVLPGAVGHAAMRELFANGAKKRPIAAGPIPEPEYAHLLNAKRTRRMSEYVKLTLTAASAACQDADVREDREFFAGCSAILGSTHGSSPFCESFYSQIVRDGLVAANPVLFAEGVPNAAAAHLSMMLGVKGGCQTLIGSRCAGLEALMLASLRIRQGLWSRAIVGAAEEFSHVVVNAYRACDLVGPGEELTSGSGAVCLVLESRGTALARRARVRAAVDTCAWPFAVGNQGMCELIAALENPSHLVCACGDLSPDRTAIRRLGAHSPRTEIWSVANFLPELFSVGPLAAIAAMLLGPIDNHPPHFGVFGNEFSGRCCGLLVDVPPDDTTRAIG